ncbi:ZIP family metal transporter [Patescibacteria group bacterium]|nr:ZIP family metal transporter [Patescibacteria group bacterium]MBU1672842.1 ZIP family metal transporter [Patescibacteria group bacterium]MBU1963737.1 ZIP family metal transporter [Patescibacteria group bacterium]
MAPIYYILLISIAGPIIGSAIGVIKKPSDLFMFNMLSFAAGVMLALSFLQLVPESINLSSVWVCSLGIIIGAIVMYMLDKLIPHIHPELCQPEKKCTRLKKTSIYLLFGIFLHNLPEGMAIASGTISSTQATFAIALAIAVHNIPEGIVTSAPYYYCTGKRLKAFLISSSTAIPIIVGFIIAYFVFQNISDQFIGFIIAATAGLMVYISADELIPSSCCRSEKKWSHSTIFSLIGGVVFVILLSSL